MHLRVHIITLFSVGMEESEWMNIQLTSRSYEGLCMLMDAEGWEMEDGKWKMGNGR